MRYNPFSTVSADKKSSQKTDLGTLLIDTSFALDQIDLTDPDQLLEDLDLTPGQLMEKVDADDEVESCIEDLRAEMASADWRLWGEDVPDDVVNPLYRNIRKHIDVFIELAITAKLGGYAVAEYQYMRDESGLFVFDRVINKKGDLDNYTPRRDGSLQWINVKGEAELLNLTVKHLLLTHRATTKKPGGEIQVARLYPALQLRRMGFLYAGQFIKRHGQPYITAKRGGQNDDEKTWLQKIFSFLNGGGMLIGSDDEVKLHQLNGDGKAFKQLENMANARIQKLLLGRVKTSDLDSGSRAAQETEEKTRNARISAYLRLLATAIQHAVDALIAVNDAYGTSVPAPKGLWFEFEQATNIDVSRAERDKRYLDSGQMRFTKSYYTQILGFEDEHIEVLEPNYSPANRQDTALALPAVQLSDDAAIEPLDPVHIDILRPKIAAILSALSDSKNYADFEEKLTTLDIGDDLLTQVLAIQNSTAFVESDNDKSLEEAV